MSTPKRLWCVFQALLWAPAFVSAQSLVCDGKIIGEGVTQAEVSAKCGKPSQVNHSTIHNGAAITTGNLTTGSVAEIQVEIWTYNFGPNKLMERIRFEDGRVVSIDSMGYGF